MLWWDLIKQIFTIYRQDKFLELTLEEKESFHSFHGFGNNFIPRKRVSQRVGTLSSDQFNFRDIMQFFIWFKSVRYLISSNRQWFTNNQVLGYSQCTKCCSSTSPPSNKCHTYQKYCYIQIPVKSKNAFPKIKLRKRWYDNSTDKTAVLNIMSYFKIYDNEQFFLFHPYFALAIIGHFPIIASNSVFLGTNFS